ncbi:MAG: tRNA pseudouridine(55) synthase TruB [Bacteroidota bacterium]|nr:tRNA pseudouridine(55) synthase TruB [Bacteroidota bacterium]
MDFLAGEVLLINKPKEWTSFDVVNKIRYLIKRKFNLKKIKVGHAGTLDPLATGLLIICTGKKTKTIVNFSELNKEYIAKVTVGGITPSFDKETEITEQFDIEHITEDLLVDTLKSFLGKQEQTPPIYSAKKINGEKAYVKARKGEDVKMKTAIVDFQEIELLEHSLPNSATIRLKVSKGTYIRSFANDLGKRMNSGAYLEELQRTFIGDYKLSDAYEIEEFVQLVNNLNSTNTHI